MTPALDAARRSFTTTRSRPSLTEIGALTGAAAALDSLDAQATKGAFDPAMRAQPAAVKKAAAARAALSRLPTALTSLQRQRQGVGRSRGPGSERDPGSGTTHPRDLGHRRGRGSETALKPRRSARAGLPIPSSARRRRCGSRGPMTPVTTRAATTILYDAPAGGRGLRRTRQPGPIRRSPPSGRRWRRKLLRSPGWRGP